MSKNVAKYKIFNSRLTSIISISMVLFLLGIISMFVYIGNQLSSHMKENLTISIEISDIAQTEDIKHLQDSLNKAPFVKELRFISKEDALKELTEEMGENPMELLNFNPLPSTFEINLKSAYANNDSILYIAQSLKNLQIIKNVDYQKNLIHEVNHKVTRITTICLAIAATLLFISFILINNTMRLLIYSNRFAINTMKLIGATKHFIRRPYIKQGIIIGLSASFLACLYIGGFFYLIHNNLDIFIDFKDQMLYLVIGGTIFASGILITTLSTLFAMNKYLRHDTNDLYYI
ncbi:MAG TPA: permease-like cell division protein FtsX [Paludibacteraceae bacterium]|nr:permease-like cell division protein FtsX [Paludibacteraceae bacterium]